MREEDNGETIVLHVLPTNDPFGIKLRKSELRRAVEAVTGEGGDKEGLKASCMVASDVRSACGGSGILMDGGRVIDRDRRSTLQAAVRAVRGCMEGRGKLDGLIYRKDAESAILSVLDE